MNGYSILRCSGLLKVPGVVFLHFLPAVFFIQSLQDQVPRIQNDVFWNTVDGQPIYSQGGGVFRFTDPATGQTKYYWYGVHYKEAEAYRKDPSLTQDRNNFVAVSCYTSLDLVNWRFENNVLSKAEVDKFGKTYWVGRLGVAYIKELKKYAMFVQHGNGVLIAVSSCPSGPFLWHQKISMKEMIGTPNTGDQTVFTDEDGKSYLVYSYGRGRNKIYVSEIGVRDNKVNLLDCTKVFQGAGREGNCMFRYKDKYYMAASNLYGWDASLAYYLVADNIRGPYLPANQMKVMEGASDDYAHVTQTGFFVTVKGSKQETVIYCGDRWADFAGNGLGYNQWVPLSIKDSQVYFNSLSSLHLDAQTGEWSVANENNFVKNGSFEADRKYIPSHVKPIQTELTGWETRVLQGNKISLDSARSPVLNHANTRDERKRVVGERSLCIGDKTDFKRIVSQRINSSAFVALADGWYSLSAMVKNSSGFGKLEMFARSGGKAFTCNIDRKEKWTKVSLQRVYIKGGEVQIGFEAEGTASAYCYVDDVQLVKEL